jgi:hypothetical protein
MTETFKPPLQWTDLHPKFEIPEWVNLECDTLKAEEASHHFFVLGETGSGKTRSAVIPLIRAAFRYPSIASYAEYEAAVRARGEVPEALENLRPSMLVIDPKFELQDYIIRLQEETGIPRQVVSLSLRQFGGVVSLFEGIDAAVVNPSEIADRLFSISTYIEREKRNARDPFWGKQAEELIKSMLAIDFHVYKQGGVEKLKKFWNDIHTHVTNRVVARTEQLSPEMSSRQAAFQKTYDLFNAAMEALHDANMRLLVLYKDSEAQKPLEDLRANMTSFATVRSDFERARVLEKLITNGKEVAAWCQQTIEATRSSPDSFVSQLVDFVVVAQRVERLGEMLLHWEAPRPENMETLRKGLREQQLGYNRACYLRPIYTLFNLSSVYHREYPSPSDPVIEAYLHVCNLYNLPPGMTLRIGSLPFLADRTYTSITATVNGFLEELASEELASYVSLNPYEQPEEEKFISVNSLIDSGACVVYSPGDDSNLANIVGRCLKMKFFEFTFKRSNRVRPFVYICDEFQRYITGDKVSGEQSFLDRCRAYRGICVLATQSLASLKYVLNTVDTGAGGEAASAAALQILLNNTGNDLYFRNTDIDTQRLILELMPAPHAYGKPHLAQVRPVSTLQVGECYYMLSNGNLGRGQVVI